MKLPLASDGRIWRTHLTVMLMCYIGTPALIACGGASESPTVIVVPTDDAGGCGEDLVACNGYCQDLNFDPFHCGACGNVCPGASGGMGVCIDGQCDVACMLGTTRCDAGCCQ